MKNLSSNSIISIISSLVLLMMPGMLTNSWANSRCKIKIDGFEKLYRSTWEAVFQILNPTCQYERLRVKYMFDGKWHNYIVDFIDEENKIVYEVKPDATKNNRRNNVKRETLIKWCSNENYTYMEINDEWFYVNAKKINYNRYDEKIKKGMKQFL